VAKGSNFERLISTRLSIWWTDGKHDDTIWRSSMSGGRATVRGRKGKRTAGHAGDLCSTDPASADLFRVLVFELKCGYQHVTLNDLIDRPTTAAFQKDGWDAWVHQAEESKRLSGAACWVIVHHRSRGKKRTMVYLDALALENDLPEVWAALKRDGLSVPSVSVLGSVKMPDGTRRNVAVLALRLDDLVRTRQATPPLPSILEAAKLAARRIKKQTKR